MIGRDLVIYLCVEVGSKNAIRIKLCLGRGVGAFFDFVLRIAQKTTPAGFEPARAEPNGFLVHLLNHSDTLS